MTFRRAMSVAAVLGVGALQSAWAEIIHRYAMQGDVDAVVAELDKGVPVDLRSTNMTSDPSVTPLFVAAKFGKAAVVEELLRRGADPTIFFEVPDALYNTGTALHHAARFGYPDVVELLLEAGADPSYYEPYIGTPLHQALRGDHAEIAQRLIEAGAPVQVAEEPLGGLVDKADPDRGAKLAIGCAICHGAADAERAVGPNGPSLYGILGRSAASDPGFEYSVELARSGLVWSEDTLNSYLGRPYQFVPGTSKVMVALQDETERAALIAYLRTLGN